jgi:PKD repeat protein
MNWRLKKLAITRPFQFPGTNNLQIRHSFTTYKLKQSDMKLRLLALFALALSTFSAPAQQYLDMIEAGTYPITAIQQAAKTHFDIVGRGQGSGYKQFKRWEYVALMELDNNGVKIPNAELALRARDYRQAEAANQAAKGSFAASWKQLGPTYYNATSGWNPGVGRVTSIGIEAANPSHLIVGSPTGGVWKSLDGGDNWTPLTDNYSTVDVYALEISPYNNQHYLWGSTSGRIFRSLDGGATWLTSSNVTGSGRVSRIQFHPTDPNVVYAVSESTGLFRSTNSGATWTAVTGASGVPGYDVEFKPGDPNTIYFSGINTYRSIDGGGSFTQITGFGTASNNYKMMGISPANPNYVYLVESNGGRFGGFYKSTDSGASFTKLIDGADINYFGYSATGDDDRGQAPRDMDVAVNPFDAEEVHIAGIHTWKSIDGGLDFALTSYWVPGTAQSLGVGYNHADIDILKFAGNTLFVGSDGGIFTSNDGAATFDNRSVGLCIKEFYKIGVSKTDPNVVSGGSQDNGTSVMRGANRLWVDWLGADGMETFVDWNNPNILYGTSQNGSMYRSTNQGNSRSSIAKPDPDEDGAWVTPFEQDPQVATTIYVAFADVWKSDNSGSTWTKISDFANGNMSQMKLAPSDNQRIYVSRGSSLFTTANAGGVWVTTQKAWGTTNISYIAVHPTDPMRLLIVTSSNVYHSLDAGNTWTTISAGLPSGAKYCAAWENTGKNGIYVGGFGFISYTNDDLAGQWVGYFDGLPNCRVYELEPNYYSNTLFACTYGRGLWESPLYQPLPPVAAFSADQRLGCHELTVTFSDNSASAPTAWEWTFQGGTPATSTEQNPVVTFTGGGTYTVTLKATNSAGSSTNEQAGYIVLLGANAPTVPDVSRCNPGELSFQATPQPGAQINWYAGPNDNTPLFTGDVFLTNLSQTTAFYAAVNTGFHKNHQIGPVDNTIGGGGDHNGGQYLILDAIQPFRLKSAKVYAVGSKNRTFQVRDASNNILSQKTIFVQNGESRVTLDLDIPQGTDLQLFCPTGANLYRNNSGPNYPYEVADLVSLKNSSAGLDYYYYLYDIEVETSFPCESDRVKVTGWVNTAPEAATVSAAGPTTICAGASVQLNAENVCPDCTVHWSNGETGPSIIVSNAGNYSATLRNTCGDSPVSNLVAVAMETMPEAPILIATGANILCPGDILELTAESICPGCALLWSTGETSASIEITTAGTYTASLSNLCGESTASLPVSVETAILPEAASIAANGPTAFCSGASVLLSAENVCSTCTVHWSNGETGTSTTVTTQGNYTAITSNMCGESEASNIIAVEVSTVPETPLVTANGPTSICSGEAVELEIQNICPGCTVVWSTGATDPNISISSPGSYAATVANACGDSPLSIPVNVIVDSLPVATTISAAGSTTLCAGEMLELTADMVCPGCTVSWSNGASGASIIVGASGDFTAVLSNGCGDSQASNTISVLVGTVPDMPIVSASGTTVLCPGASVELAPDNPCAGCTFKWSTGEGSPSITVTSAGTYSLVLSNACGDSPASAPLTFTEATVPGATTISASASTQLCPGQSVMLVAEDVCANCIVNWSNGITGPSIIVSDAGTYNANLSNGCGVGPESNTIEVSVFPPFIPIVGLEASCHLSAPAGSNYQWFLDGVAIQGANQQTWTAQVAGAYTVAMSSLDGCAGTSAAVLAEACVSGTQELSGNLSVQVYPNPATDHLFLNIKALHAANIRFELFAADGRYVAQLFKGEIVAGTQTLDISLPDIPAGMYRYRLAAENGSVQGNLVVMGK